METNENVVVEEQKKVPRILLEILVFGKEKDKKKIYDLNSDLQEQISKHRKAKHRARIFWRINNDETIDEMKQWLIENSECKYFVCATDGKTFDIKSDFVLTTLNKIQKLENAIESIKNSNINISRKNSTK